MTGGDIGAKQAKLTILVGGDAEAFNKAKPILKKMGKNVVYLGGPGSGQQAKLANQIMVAGNMIGMVEGLVYARRAGLDLDTVVQTLSQGAAASWSLTNMAPRILQNNFDPGFAIEHFIKDMRIALEECQRMGLELKGLKLVESLYSELQRQGHGKKGSQALILALDGVK